MTKQEAAIVSAYTGILLGKFTDMHRYIEKIMKRPIFTHELGNKNMTNKVKEKSKSDFLKLEVK